MLPTHSRVTTGTEACSCAFLHSNIEILKVLNIFFKKIFTFYYCAASSLSCGTQDLCCIMQILQCGTCSSGSFFSWFLMPLTYLHNSPFMGHFLTFSHCFSVCFCFERRLPRQCNICLLLCIILAAIDLSLVQEFY